MTGLRAEMIELDTVDGPMATYVAHPDGEPLGGVVVVQEAFGLTGHIRGVAESLARAGFLAVAPALFHRCEPQVFGYEDYQSLGPVIMTRTAESIGVDVDCLPVLDLGRPETGHHRLQLRWHGRARHGGSAPAGGGGHVLRRRARRGSIRTLPRHRDGSGAPDALARPLRRSRCAHPDR